MKVILNAALWKYFSGRNYDSLMLLLTRNPSTLLSLWLRNSNRAKLNKAKVRITYGTDET